MLAVNVPSDSRGGGVSDWCGQSAICPGQWNSSSHMHDLCPALDTDHSESNELSSNEVLMDCVCGPLENVTASSSNNLEVETVVPVPLQKATPSLHYV